MAISGVTYDAPCIPVDSFEVTKISGNWPAGTYDFMCVVMEGAASTYRPQSSPVYQMSIVLNGSEGIKITITWNASHSSIYYAHFYYNSTAVYGRWLYQQVSGYLGLQYPNTTYDFPSHTINVAYMAVATIESPTRAKINTQLSCGSIRIHGDCGTITLKQLFDDMLAEGYLNNEYSFYDGYNMFLGCWSIYSETGAIGTLNITGFSCWFYIINFQITTFSIKSYWLRDITNFGAFRQSGSSVACYLFNAQLLGVTLAAGCYNLSSYVAGSMQIFTNSDTVFRKCLVMTPLPRLDYPDTFDGSIIYGTYMMVIGLNAAEYAKPFVIYGYLRFYYQHHQMWLRDSEFYVVDGYKFCDYTANQSNPNNYEQKLLDCKFIHYASSTDFTPIATYDYPTIINWVGLPSSEYQMLRIEHSLNIKIVDDDGNMLGAVDLKIYDKNNNLIYSDSSIDGEYDEIQLTCKEIQHTPDATSGIGEDKQTIIDQYPFTIVFSKDGYEDYSVKILVLNEKIETVIMLEKSKPSIMSVEITDCTAVGASNGQLEVTADSYYSVQYSINGTDYQDGNVFTGLAKGTYTIYVRDSNGEIVTMGNVEIVEPVLQYKNVQNFAVETKGRVTSAQINRIQVEKEGTIQVKLKS